VPWTLAQTLAGTAITLVPWLLVLGLTATTSSGTTGLTKPLPRATDLLGGIIFFLFSALVECAFLLVPLYFTLWRRAPGVSRQEALRALGFRRVALGRAAGWVAGGLAASLVATFAYGVLVQILHLSLQTNGDALLQEAKYAPLTVLGALLAAVFFAPICEEIFFRGFLFGGLLRGMTIWPAVALSALLFAVAHGEVGSFVPLLVFGLVLAIARFKLGSIWPGMTMHILNNALTSVVIVVAILHP
jgi:membrane protease YdiL (CAAX protease family)